MMRMRWLLPAAAVMFVAACSSTSAPSESGSSSRSESPAAHGSFADCLKANGVDETAAPAAVLGPPEGVDQSTWQQAMQACSSLAPGPAGP